MLHTTARVWSTHQLKSNFFGKLDGFIIVSIKRSLRLVFYCLVISLTFVHQFQDMCVGLTVRFGCHGCWAFGSGPRE